MKKKYINRLKRITKHVGEWSYPPKHDRERGKKAWQLNPAENQSRGNSPKNTQSVTQKRREDTILSHNNCLKVQWFLTILAMYIIRLHDGIKSQSLTLFPPPKSTKDINIKSTTKDWSWLQIWTSKKSTIEDDQNVGE